jgi:CubicO group peptidase (beta-lactamase class C family)
MILGERKVKLTTPIANSGAKPAIEMTKATTALESARWPSDRANSRESVSSRSALKRMATFSRWALLCLSFLVLASASFAQVDDNENSTPTAWWIYTGQTFNDIGNTIKNLNARVIDIKVDPSSPNPYTVTYVQNTGSYARQWWWYVGIDAQTLSKNLSTNNGRLISLKAYDIGGGNIRFAVAMVSNTGANAKEWWYYYGKSTADVSSLTQANKARLTSLQSYASNGQTLYAFIMIANKGTDDKGWWWYFNVNTQAVGNAISTNKARLLDLTSAGNGNFNAAMESCSSGCPGWWWYYGLDANGVLSEAQNNGARVLTADTYEGCNGSSPCFDVVMIGNTPSDITACDTQGCISEAKLSGNICGTLANHVVGYSCLVGGMRPGYGGLARTASDPPSTPMAPDLSTDIASVSKTMTATGILQLLANAGLTIDTKISPYIYPDWPQGQNINQLTFKELLTHSSGFGQLPNNICGNNISYAGLKTIVAGGVAANIGVPSYGNCNFALLRELMPALSGQPLTNIPDGPQRAQQSSSMYISYMNAHVFQPVGVPARDCTPSAGTSGILSYPNPAGTTQGTDWGDQGLQCGSGGWVLSANDIFKVINSLANDNTLLTSAEKKQMFADCLGWDCAVRSDCPSPYVCKNGGLSNGSGTSISTYAGILKCNVPVVVIVNSPIPAPNQDPIDLVENAFNQAAVPGTPQACP